MINYKPVPKPLVYPNGKYEIKPPVYSPGWVVDTESGYSSTPGQINPLWLVAGVIGLLWYFGR